MIYDEKQHDDCIKDDYQQIKDQFSRMIDILLKYPYSLTLTVRWAAIESLNPQNIINKD